MSIALCSSFCATCTVADVPDLKDEIKRYDAIRKKLLSQVKELKTERDFLLDLIADIGDDIDNETLIITGDQLCDLDEIERITEERNKDSDDEMETQQEEDDSVKEEDGMNCFRITEFFDKQ